MSEEELMKARYVYLGTIENGTPKDVCVVLRPVPEFYEAEEFSASLSISHPDNAIFSQKGMKTGALRYATPGAVVEIERTKDGRSVIPASAVAVERWFDRDRVVSLQAAERARESERAARRDSKKIAERDELLDALEPIRAAYHRSVGANRVHLLARIVAYLTS